MLLLMAQWNRDGNSLPNDQEKLKRVARCGRNWPKIWGAIGRYFSTDENGVYSTKLREWDHKAHNAAPRPWVPLAVQRFVFERDGNVCAYCKTTDGPFHLDHIYPWSLGGEHAPENLTVACAQCNWSKGSKTLSEWRAF
jgi:hypothetical protein